jgi:lipoprotein NlpD
MYMNKILDNSLILFLLLITFPFCGCVKDYVKSESKPGHYYVIKKGDTLYRIAIDHKTSVEELADLNNLENIELVTEGMTLFIPGEKPDPENIKDDDQKYKALKDAPKNQTKKKGPEKSGDKSGKGVNPKKTDAKISTEADLPKDSVKDESKEKIKESAILKKEVLKEKDKFEANRSAVPPDRVSGESTAFTQEVANLKGKFMWPLKGKVISQYGPQANGMFYNGIRIETRVEASVNAASGGHVIFSALLKDYGETVIIKHDNNYATVYTHLSKRVVRVDQLVKRGEKIAMIIPASTGVGFIDFEIRYKNKAKDPLLFLS